MEKWLQKQGYEYEVQTATDGGKLYFIPYTFSKFDDRMKTIRNYIKKFKPNLTSEFRANYTWIAIHEPK